jgi:hypothetical protein
MRTLFFLQFEEKGAHGQKEIYQDLLALTVVVKLQERRNLRLSQ